MRIRMIKFILCIILVIFLALPCFALPTFKDSDGEVCFYDETLLEFGDFYETMYPGVDYYIPLYYMDEPMNDEVLEMYTVSFAYFSLDSEVSNSKFRDIFEKVEFIRDIYGNYYVHIIPESNKYKNCYNGEIAVYAKDKLSSSNRLAAVLEVEVDFRKEYTTGSSTELEERTSLSFINEGGFVNFDKSLKDERVNIEFYDESTINFRLGKNLKYDLRYTTYVPYMLKAYNKEAKIWAFNFYSHQEFENIINVKIKAPKDAKYFYEVLPDGSLGYITDNISPTGTFGKSTRTLGTYIMSDTKLVNTYYNVFSYSPGSSKTWVKNPPTGVNELI